ncbi:MAG: lysine--tRNA ligase, partial [Clostridia bacterium]|nr:lysine--tRNA ligase [Clostridia bacterium]
MSEERIGAVEQRPEVDANEVRKVRIEKLNELSANGQNPFELTSYDRTATAGEIVANYAEFEGKSVRIAGRLVSKRIMGKASFGHILDSDGKMQGYFSRDDMGVDEYQSFKKMMDVGDII